VISLQRCSQDMVVQGFLGLANLEVSDVKMAMKSRQFASVQYVAIREHCTLENEPSGPGAVECSLRRD